MNDLSSSSFKKYLDLKQQVHLDDVEVGEETVNLDNFFEDAIQEQGRGQIMDTMSDIQERHDVIQEIDKGMVELHQLFIDLTVLMEAQGYQLIDIESHVAHASSFVMRGADQLELAKEYQKSSKKWGCIAFAIAVFLLVIILFPVLSSILIKNA
ncbi:syntaxin-124-like [Gossypium arboreum]|uniref:syntaxin-124-like n=1 Tax=Gossypium arboreum TaxID=29729 RepID=UPI0008194221|nr:syntaxin-124-like [Gossypium arboreum]